MRPVTYARARRIFTSSSAPSGPIHQRRGEFIALLIDYLNSATRERRVQLSHWSDRLSRWTSRPVIGRIPTGTTTKGARPLINSSDGLVISRLFRYFRNDVCPMTVTKRGTKTRGRVRWGVSARNHSSWVPNLNYKVFVCFSPLSNYWLSQTVFLLFMAYGLSLLAVLSVSPA